MNQSSLHMTVNLHTHLLGFKGCPRFCGGRKNARIWLTPKCNFSGLEKFAGESAWQICLELLQALTIQLKLSLRK